MKSFLIGVLVTYAITGIVLWIDYKCIDRFDRNEYIVQAYCWWIKLLIYITKPIVWLLNPFIHIRLALYLMKWKCNPWSFTFGQLKDLPYEARAGIIKYVPKYNKDIMKEILHIDQEDYQSEN